MGLGLGGALTYADEVVRLINMKATKQVTDSKGTVWTIFHAPIGIFDDYHEGRNSLGYKTSFHTRSGALKWLKRNTEVSAH